MWYIDLTKYHPQKIEKAQQAILLKNMHTSELNSVYEVTKNEEIVKYLSHAMWNPVPQTWVQAIHKGFFATWPGLTTKLVNKYLETQEETIKGHQRAVRSNVRSTKNKMEPTQKGI